LFESREDSFMRSRGFLIGAGIGCAVLVILLVIVIPSAFMAVSQMIPVTGDAPAQNNPTASVEGIVETQQAVPTLEVERPRETIDISPGPLGDTQLPDLYQQLNPGVVNIQVLATRGGGTGTGAGSGFLIDDEGHIVTNSHVVFGATQITVIFWNGFEANAELIGEDDDVDLAVIRVDNIPDGAHPLVIGDSNEVMVGEWVVAIGNPFGLGSSMSVGIVSAVGRTLPVGATPFRIPQAIQTDAAINPGNSGGPLMNLNGEVIGVNAQIATSGGIAANAGVGFAIPSNIVRLVAPVLIETGMYQWPWLGVEGTSVNMLIANANNLETQNGAYIITARPGGPAETAGIQGANSTTSVGQFNVPVGGDVIVEVDGQPVRAWEDLLSYVAFKDPGETVALTVLRNGEEQEINVTLEERPAGFDNGSQSPQTIP
jgi:S1-C subfamily serine protease